MMTSVLRLHRGLSGAPAVVGPVVREAPGLSGYEAVQVEREPAKTQPMPSRFDLALREEYAAIMPASDGGTLERRRLAVGALCAIACVTAVIVPIALANHVHTVGWIYHGLGDGGDYDDYIHPFTDSMQNCVPAGCPPDNNFLRAGLWKKREGDDRNLWSDTCYGCGHLHRNWDATGCPDRAYYSTHKSDGYTDYQVNIHDHFHHDGAVNCS